MIEVRHHALGRKSSLGGSATTAFIPLRELVGGSSPAPRACAYVTDFRPASADEAGERLALSYSPRFWWDFPLDPSRDRLLGNDGNPLGRSALRVWPAFGRIGGAREIVWDLTTPGGAPRTVDLAGFAKEGELGDGGRVFGHRQSDATNVVVRLAAPLLSGVGSAVQVRELPFENGLVKITDDGVAFNATNATRRSQSPLNLTISVGFALYPLVVKLRFWGCLWRDEAPRVRWMVGPEVIDLDVPVACLAARAEPGGNWKRTLDAIVESGKEQIAATAMAAATDLIDRLTRAERAGFDRWAKPALIPA